MKNAFSFAATPYLHFGPGKLAALPSIIKRLGRKILLITGRRSFLSSAHGRNLLQQFRDNKITLEEYHIDQEPTPLMIDAAVKKFSVYSADCVVAIGGGSVLDAGKAISAMLPLQLPVKDYIEGVGKNTHPGEKVPFIAIPTTAGTGSEATKNAVISQTGENGYKRSLRHDNFVPNFTIVDPLLTISCPPIITATSGMDAFTQLLESYLSTASNPLTDSLALEGLEAVSRSLLKVYRGGGDVQARTDMALAAYLSGITLANAGLGLVHGFASPIGGYFEISHGIICSTLMPASNKLTVRKLRKTNANPEALKKFARVGRIFSKDENRSDDFYIDSLLSTLDSMKAEMKIPSLSEYGINKQNYEKIVKTTDNKNNPVMLDKDEMTEVLAMAGA